MSPDEWRADLVNGMTSRLDGIEKAMVVLDFLIEKGVDPEGMIILTSRYQNIDPFLLGQALVINTVELNEPILAYNVDDDIDVVLSSNEVVVSFPWDTSRQGGTWIKYDEHPPETNLSSLDWLIETHVGSPISFYVQHLTKPRLWQLHRYEQVLIPMEADLPDASRFR